MEQSSPSRDAGGRTGSARSNLRNTASSQARNGGWIVPEPPTADTASTTDPRRQWCRRMEPVSGAVAEPSHLERGPVPVEPKGST